MNINVHILFFLSIVNKTLKNKYFFNKWDYLVVILLAESLIASAYCFKLSRSPVRRPTADKRLNLDTKKFLSEIAKFILESSKIDLD